MMNRVWPRRARGAALAIMGAMTLIASASAHQTVPTIPLPGVSAAAPAPGDNLLVDVALSGGARLARSTAEIKANPVQAEAYAGAMAGSLRRLRGVDVDRAAIRASLGTDVVPARDETLVLTAAKPVRLGLFADADVMIQPQTLTGGLNGAQIIQAGVVGKPQSSVTIVLADAALVMDATIDGRYYHVAPAARAIAALHVVSEIDPGEFPHGPNAVRAAIARAGVDGAAAAASAPAASGAKATASATATATTTGPYTVKLLVVYTREAAAKSSAGIEVDIQAAVATVNRVWSNSSVNGSIRLMAMVPLGSDYPDAADMGDQLDAASAATGTTSQRAIMHNRNLYSADLVSIVSEGSTTCGGTAASGCGYVNSPTISDGNGFSIVLRAGLATGTTMAHEIGHNMGLHHDRVEDKITDQSVYNVGYVSIAGRARDVMSYSLQCTNAGVNCAVNPSYSSPNITVNGYPLGIAAGSKDPADGARAVNDTIAAISQFRTIGQTVDDAATPGLAVALTGAVSATGSRSLANIPSGSCTEYTTNGPWAKMWWSYTPATAGTLTVKATNAVYMIIAQGTPDTWLVTSRTPTNASAPTAVPLEGVASVAASQTVYIATCGSQSASLPVGISLGFALPQTGWWWAPSKGGMGFSIESHLGNYFLAEYVYDATTGEPYWAVGSGTMTNPARIDATLAKYTGGRPFGTTMATASGNGNDGTVSFRFTSPTAGVLVDGAGNQTAIQRYVFDTASVNYLSASNRPAVDTGWYWDPNAGGRGFFMERQGATIFLALFHYTSSGVPVWHVATDTLTTSPAGTFTGQLVKYVGGPNITSGARSASAVSPSVGTFTIQPGYTLSTGSAPALSDSFNWVTNGSGQSSYYAGYGYGLLGLPSALNVNGATVVYQRYRF